jgi:hypothetical protein
MRGQARSLLWLSRGSHKGMQCLNEGGEFDACFRDLNYAAYHDFDFAVIERSVKGKRIETEDTSGWTWPELAKIDPAAGGASRAQVDALRLMAIFLGHWDNKNKNQRLLCLSSSDDKSTCAHPAAMVQDLGATLDRPPGSTSTIGPRRLSGLTRQRAPCRCGPGRVAARAFRRAHFRRGSSVSRRAAEQLSAQQISDLFEGARVPIYPHKNPTARDVNQWVRAFQAKVRAISDRGPCPS